MAWGYVAASVIGGAFASDAQSSASDANKDAAAIGAASDAAVLDFEKGKYQDWKDIYGDLEQNLSDFYTDLTPEYLIGAGIEIEAKELATAQNNVKTSLAQRGLGGGGLEADLIAGQEVASAENRARIRKEAPFKVAEAQQGFLSSNLANKSAAERNISSALRQSGNTQTQFAVNNASIAQNAANSLYNSTGRLLSTGLEQFSKQKDPEVPTVNTGQVATV